MPIDPQIAAMLAAAPAWPKVSTLPVATLREAVRASSTAFPPLGLPLAGVENHSISGPGGPLKLRIYRPIGEGPFPVTVYFHGGGWVVGDLDTQDMIARGLAFGAHTLVISVDYRLAPEQPFPAAPNDCWAATLWAAKHAAELGGDPRMIAVAGDSAGANLATGVALRARDGGSPHICAQVMFYGSGNYPAEQKGSALEFADGPVLTWDDVQYFWKTYLADPAKYQNDPLASPLCAADHRGLPPAFMATAEIDPTRDDGERYMKKLRDAGVIVDCHRYAGMVHGFVSWLGILPGAQKAMDDACAFLKAHFPA